MQEALVILLLFAAIVSGVVSTFVPRWVGLAVALIASALLIPHIWS